ncbi:MAG: diacylglycerol kinase family protein, partial [Cyanobacteria bacterium J06600_6]
MEDRIIFTGQLAIYPETTRELAVLTPAYLSWQQGGIKKQLDLSDVVGTSLVNDPSNNQPCLLVSAYLQPKANLIALKQRRVLQDYYFTCENLEQRLQWQKAIDNTLAGREINADIKPRHLEIIINPTSGQGKATEIFDRVRPLFERANLSYSVTETKSAVDTQNVVQGFNLSQTDGLVIVGGDGYLHDAIAGLMSRDDCDRAMKVPLGIIPGGTGNGLCKSILEAAGESYDPLNAAFIIARGKQQSFDLAQMTQGDLQYYSFLSLAWGLISDADLESEKLRFLGSYRFDIYALFLISLLRTYRGRFSFIPHHDCQIYGNQATDKEAEWQIIEDDFIFLWGMNTPWAAHDMNVTPLAKLNDGAIDVLVMRRGTSRLELLKALLRCGKGKHLDLPHMEYYKVKTFKLEPLTDKGVLLVDGEKVDYSAIGMRVLPNSAIV